MTTPELELGLPPANPPKPRGLPAVLLFRGRGLISWLIRWQTRGNYSHAALLRPDGMIVEAWQGKGVQVKAMTDLAEVDIYSVAMTPEQWGTALDYATSQVGRGYDYWAVIRFIDRRNMPANDKWFCSELVFESLARAGVRLFERIMPWAVSPGLIAISPMLTLNNPPPAVEEPLLTP